MTQPKGRNIKGKKAWQDAPESEMYARKRGALRKRRDTQEHVEFDPRPVSDEDWSVANETDEPSLKRISAPEPIGDVLGNLVSRQGWASRLQGVNLFRYWHDICGEELAAHCEPVRLAGGILVLRVESQIWATQLRYCVPEITESVRTRLGIDEIRDVRIVIGPLENRSE